jgi:hypothetical protein
MRNLFAGVTFAIAFACVSPQANTQDHAPTAEQCLADMRLWRSQMTEYLDAETAHINMGSPNNSELMKLTARQLNHRAYEMGKCAIIDPSRADDYNGELNSYSEARKDRFVSFVLRHHLEKEFYQEDEAGKR